MRYLKLTKEQASNFDFKITEAIKEQLPNLKLEAGRDIRDYLVWEERDGFLYVVTTLFDLENRNRINKETEAETRLWDSVIKENNWEVVSSLEG